MMRLCALHECADCVGEKNGRVGWRNALMAKPASRQFRKKRSSVLRSNVRKSQRVGFIASKGRFQKQWDWGLKSTAFARQKQCFRWSKAVLLKGPFHCDWKALVLGGESRLDWVAIEALLIINRGAFARAKQALLKKGKMGILGILWWGVSMAWGCAYFI